MSDIKDRAAVEQRGQDAGWARHVAPVYSVEDEADRLCRVVRYIANPTVLSAELRWQLAATGVTVEALRECLRLVEGDIRLPRL